jgi:hypothetical protein
MTTYLYVLATLPADKLDGYISFWHCTVNADTDERAYRLGVAKACKAKLLPLAPGTNGNDYVIRLTIKA